MKRQHELGNDYPKIDIKYSTHRDSFKNGNWETVLLQKGDTIYRFFGSAKPEDEVGSFWIDGKTYDVLESDPNLKSIVGMVRARLAILEVWNKMDMLVPGGVIKEFYAAFGPANFQRFKEKGYENVFYIGGMNQLYILPEDYYSILHFSSSPT